MKTLKEKGIKILPLVGSANQALLLEKAGADGVIAEGKEIGWAHWRCDYHRTGKRSS